MTASVQHAPKSGATLTGAEYEAADHHTISGVALEIHTHDYAAAAHAHDTYATSSHTHDTYAIEAHTHPAPIASWGTRW